MRSYWPIINQKCKEFETIAWDSRRFTRIKSKEISIGINVVINTSDVERFE